MPGSLRKTVDEIYTGATRRAERFRYALIAFDLITIMAFLVTAPMEQTRGMEVAGLVIGMLIATDFAARLWIAPDRRAMLLKIYTLADVVVVISLLISPFIHQNIAFLRILRGLRIIHSYHLLRDLRRASVLFRRHEETVIAVVNLFVFVFFTTSVVHAMFADKADGLNGYIDALYFTVTTLTTTGYGDITPQTTGGKLMSVLIMLVGVALFVQLARAIIQPAKVNMKCQTCGLLKHDPDAVHCKHCGEVVHIETSGRN